MLRVTRQHEQYNSKYKRVKLNAGQKASQVKVRALSGQTVEIESGSLKYITVL